MGSTVTVKNAAGVQIGTALGNFGVDHMLDGLIDWAPQPMPRKTDSRLVEAAEEKIGRASCRERV